MKLVNAAALVRDDLTTIRVVHWINNDVDYNKEYDYKCLRTLANRLAEDDLVVVKNARGICICKVKEIHAEPQINLDSDINYRWAFQRVDTQLSDELEAEDRAIVKRLQHTERRRARAQTLEALGVTPDEVKQITRQAAVDASMKQEKNRA